jgi:hypothetical protein
VSRASVVLVLALVACDREPAPAPGPSATASAPTPATRATITVDAAHDKMTAKDAAPYTIAPSIELVVDLSSHRFARDGGPREPDVVHVARGADGYWRGGFTGTRATLGPGSLDPVKGGAFAGFEAGESYVVALGFEAASTDGAMRFTPLWTGAVKVLR